MYRRRTYYPLSAHEFGPGHATAANQAFWTSVGTPGVSCWSFLDNGNDQYIGWSSPHPAMSEPINKHPERWNAGDITDIELFFRTSGTNTGNFNMLIGVQSKAINEVIVATTPETLQFAPSGTVSPGGLSTDLGRIKHTLATPVTTARKDWLGIILCRENSNGVDDTNTDSLYFIGCALYRD